jgi:hypothetical protein
MPTEGARAAGTVGRGPSALFHLMLVAGLFSAFSPCTMAVTPSQSEPVLHWQLFVDLLAAVVVVVVTRAAGRLRE